MQFEMEIRGAKVRIKLKLTLTAAMILAFMAAAI